MAGVALFSCSPVGSVSPRLIPDCAGLLPLLVSVKTSVVAAPSLIGLAPKVLATVGAPAVTTRQLAATPLVRLVVALMLAAPLVKAAGVAAQLALVCVAAFVTPATVTVQEPVPDAIAIPVNPDSTCVPPL